MFDRKIFDSLFPVTVFNVKNSRVQYISESCRVNSIMDPPSADGQLIIIGELL